MVTIIPQETKNHKSQNDFWLLWFYKCIINAVYLPTTAGFTQLNVADSSGIVIL